ncbi:MAG: hypothetical protein QMD46_07010 [Methanomicrobiales archaeon]|mgnify:CR=1 FL=1|nr:hypothetical protein [Methanomicrobiales archaeon]MDI6876389.1 hypothetical protein [Methanomicrobiales archaeon]
MVLGLILGLAGAVCRVLDLMKWLNPMTWVWWGIRHVLHTLLLITAIAGILGAVLIVLAFFFGPMRQMQSLRGMCPLRGLCPPPEAEEKGGAAPR